MTLSPSQLKAIGPNVASDMFLWRPTRSEPPLATRQELRTVYNLDDLFDMNEILDIEAHLSAKAVEEATRPRPGRR